MNMPAKVTVDLLEYNHFYLMGIKGVAMTSFAQILVQAGKTVRGSDVEEEFVTQKQLNKLEIKIDIGFDQPLPPAVDCLIYSAAHGGPKNPQVQAAIQAGIPAFSQAQALGSLFNQQQGIAVCGVGGKSTVSAMIAWVLEQVGVKPNFSVGVGDILGLGKTGQWNPDSSWFVAEADEYAIDPHAPQENRPITPRFSFLKPKLTVCTTLQYDHPDIYPNFAATKQAFADFFKQIKSGGSLIYNQDNPDLEQLIEKIKPELKAKKISLLSFGTQPSADLQLTNFKTENQTIAGSLAWYSGQSRKNNQAAGTKSTQASKNILTPNQTEPEIFSVQLKIPGKFNLMNAMAAATACYAANIPFAKSLAALKKFSSTQRRFQFVAEKNGVIYIDDYAHHPHEIESTLQALSEWYPAARIVAAFQPHTFSRTKSLFAEFKTAFSLADEILLLDIFPSAREKFDPTISSDMLAEEIAQLEPGKKVVNLKTIPSLAEYCQNQLETGDVLITLGAGDIYQVHQMIG